jgi:hypothetical protein
MPRISIIGVRTGHLVNARRASPLCISFDLEGSIAISRPIPSWVDCITSIGVLHNGLYFSPFSHEPIERAGTGRSRFDPNRPFGGLLRFNVGSKVVPLANQRGMSPKSTSRADLRRPAYRQA